MKMHAMVMKEPGPANLFIYQEVEKPLLQPGHLLIEVKATSVNPIDTKVRSQKLPFSPDFPAILHVDFAGIVKDVPTDVKGFSVGDMVYGVGGGIKGTIGGALAEYLLVDANLVSSMPKNLSFAQAATLPLVSITAWEALVDKLRIQAGNTLLVHAGLGGVGHIAAQLGKALGAIVHTTVSKDENKDESKFYGALHAINYKTTPVEEYVKTYTENKGFDCVFDTVGKENLENSFKAAKLNGSIACIQTGGSHDLSPMYVKGLSLHSVLMLIPLITGLERDHFGVILKEIKKLVEAGKIKPLVHPQIFNWKQAAEAHQLQESAKQRGKIAIVIEN